MIVNKIISGGQTGVDRAGLDAAIASGIDVGGYTPKGSQLRLSHAGIVSQGAPAFAVICSPC